MTVSVIDAPGADPRVLDVPNGTLTAAMLPEGSIVRAAGQAWLAWGGVLRELPNARVFNRGDARQSVVDEWVDEGDPLRRFRLVVELARLRGAVLPSDAIGVLLALLRMVLPVVPDDRRRTLLAVEFLIASSVGRDLDDGPMRAAHEVLGETEGLPYSAVRVFEGVQSVAVATLATRRGAAAMTVGDWSELRRRGVDALVCFADGWASAQAEQRPAHLGAAGVYAQADVAIRERMSAIIAERVNAHDVAATYLGVPRFPALPRIHLGGVA